MSDSGARPAITGETMGWLRAGVGVALLVAPGPPLRMARRDPPTASARLLLRTIGIRDLVLGLGTVHAARTGTGTDLRRWTTATMASDGLDVVASLASAESIGVVSATVAALLALAFVGGDVEALRRSTLASARQG